MACAQGDLRAFEDAAAWSRTGINRKAKSNRAGTYPLKGDEDTRGRLWPVTNPMPGKYRNHEQETVSMASGALRGQVGIKAHRHLQTLATRAANLCGVKPAMFAALIARESSWNPRAISSAGAIGLAQVKPSTAREMGLDARDTWQNLLAGACYLRREYDRAGTWRGALFSYHAGPWRRRTHPATIAYAADILEGSN